MSYNRNAFGTAQELLCMLILDPQVHQKCLYCCVPDSSKVMVGFVLRLPSLLVGSFQIASQNKPNPATSGWKLTMEVQIYPLLRADSGSGSNCRSMQVVDSLLTATKNVVPPLCILK